MPHKASQVRINMIQTFSAISGVRRPIHVGASISIPIPIMHNVFLIGAKQATFSYQIQLKPRSTILPSALGTNLHPQSWVSRACCCLLS